MNDITSILSAIENGDPKAADQLLPLVYDELRKLAAQKFAQRSRDSLGRHGIGPRGVPSVGGACAARLNPPLISIGTRAATSSPPRPRPCDAS